MTQDRAKLVERLQLAAQTLSSPPTGMPFGGVRTTLHPTRAKQIGETLTEAIAALASTPEAQPHIGDAAKCDSCDGTGTDLYDGTQHDCQICNGLGYTPRPHETNSARPVEGMVLVPIEATDAMTNAGQDLWLGKDNRSCDWAAKLGDTWSAMIQASQPDHSGNGEQENENG